jgi:hypothetical protein
MSSARASCTRSIAIALAFAFAPACKQETPPSLGEPKAPSAVAPRNEAAAPAPASPTGETTKAALPAPEAAAAGSKLSEGSFDLELRPKGTYAAGQQAEAELVLDAKPPYKVNDEYPYKFKLKEAAGVKFPAPVVGKDLAKLEKQKVTMPVAFTPEAAGKCTLSGQLAFSVCTDDKCLIEKRDVSLVVDVK